MNSTDIIRVLRKLNVSEYNSGSRNVYSTCFPAGTPILTEYGITAIEQVPIGSRVVTFDRGLKPVTAVHSREYSGQVVTLKVRGLNQAVTATAEHPTFMVPRHKVQSAIGKIRQFRRKLGKNSRGAAGEILSGVDVELRPIRDISVGDFVVVPNTPAACSEIIIDIAKYDRPTAMPHGGIRHTRLTVPTSYVLDYDLAYLFGLWAAEGSISYYKNTPNALLFSFGTGESVISRCRRLVRDKFGLTTAGTPRGSCHNLFVGSAMLARWFEDMLGSGAANKRVPACIIEGSNDVIRGFIDGLVEGDGYTYAGKSVRAGSWTAVETISVGLSTHLIILLSRLGIPCRLTRKMDRTDRNGVHHSDSWCVAWAKKPSRCAGRRIGGMMAYPVKERAVKHFSGDVFNLTVGVGETYAVGAVAVHNCPLAKWQHPKGRDENPSMSIKVDPIGDSACMCWSGACGFRGTITSLSKMVNHLSGGQHDEAVELAEKLECADLQARLDAVFSDDAPEEEVLFDESKLAPFARRVPRYAVAPIPDGRGLTIDTCKEWELGYDDLRHRLVVPVRNLDSDLVGMMGRSIYKHQLPKWYAYWGFSKGRYLYGEHKIDLSLKRVIVVEGMPDVWRPWMFGHRNIVALLGSRLTSGHASLLLRWGLDVYWFLDGNDAGREGTSQCIGLMRGKLPQYTIKCPEGEDPGSIKTKEEMDAIISAAEFVL